MKKHVATLIAVGVALAQQTPPAPGGRGGRGGGQNQPAVASLSKRPSGSSLGTIRVGAADNNIWFGWRVGIPTAAFRQLTFSEALVKADTLGVASVEASSAQKVSPEVPKNLDYRLQAGERAAVNHRLRELNLQIGAYHVDNIGSDESSRRNVFDFAKAVNIPMIVVPEPASLAGLDKLAEEFGINVAVESRKDPNRILHALAGVPRRMGVAADLGGWIQEGIRPVDGLALVKDRLMTIRVRDRNALGARGHDVTLGSGAAGLPDFFLSAFRAGLKPLYITVDATGAPDT